MKSKKSNSKQAYNSEESKTKEIQSRSMWSEAGGRLKRNKAAMLGLITIIAIILIAIFADFIAPYHYAEQNLRAKSLPPSREHLLGTDHLGRDVLSRLIYGSRTSILVGFLGVGFSLLLGVPLGAIAGYYGGKVDSIIMRFCDIFLAIPAILLAIAIVSALGGSTINVMIAVGISYTPRFARLIRGSVLSIREEEFIEGAKCLGASDARIIMKHILPNAMAPIIVQSTLNVAGAILSAAGLSYIGLGAKPPTAEWGQMLSSGQDHIRNAWWMSTFPGVAIAITVLALNLFGDGLRDALDPRLKD